MDASAHVHSNVGACQRYRADLDGDCRAFFSRAVAGQELELELEDGLLVQRLLEAIAVLGRVRAARADAPLQLGPLTERLESEARLHADATREVQALLS